MGNSQPTAGPIGMEAVSSHFESVNPFLDVVSVYVLDLTAQPSPSEGCSDSRSLRKLEQAGLIAKSGSENGASEYKAETFELTLTVGDVAVSITPAIVEAGAHDDAYPVISRVLDDYGVVAFALAHDFVAVHSEGEITIRQIATRTGLSSGTTYDVVEALYEIHALGEEDSGPTTYTPADFPEEDTGLRDQLSVGS